MDPLQHPIFIVGTPQSGTTYVFSALARLPGAITLDQRARDAFARAAELPPALRGHDSNRRTDDDATPETVQRIRATLRELEGRLIDGAPRHALRIPFLAAVFPDAMFVYVYRSPRETIAGMIEAWRSGLYVTYPRLPDWPGPPWSMLLVPGWRSLAGKSVAEIATAQWTTTTRFLLDDLQALAPHRWAVVDYAALLGDPGGELERLAGVLGLAWRAEAAGDSPVTHVLRPSPPRLTELEDDLQRLLPQTIGLAEVAHDLLAAPVSRRPTATPDFEAETRSVHSAGFAALLDRLDSSLLLSTGATGKLVCVRHDGARVNTHFHDLAQAGSLAAAANEFAVASGNAVHRYRERDACFVPQARVPVTASALAFAAGDLWIASGDSLELLADGRSERWRLPFGGGSRWRITGLAVDGGRPAYVCAEPASADRRAGEPTGGCVVECATGEVIAEGLAAPRGLQLHDGRLLVLERDLDRVSVVEPDSGERLTVAELPGSPRGLAVLGSTAFVALSRVRSADSVPSAAPFSGVSVVDLGRGVVGGYLRFEGEIAEVSDVVALPFRYPEIAAGY